LRVVVCSAAVVAVTSLLVTVRSGDRPLTAALTFLFVVLIVSTIWGFRYAVLVSFLAALGFSWLVPPVGSLKISETRDIFALVAFLVIGITSSHLSDRARKEALNAEQRRVQAVAAEQRFRDLVNSVEGIVWEADAETFAFSFVSDQAERVLGYATKQWLEGPTFWKDHLHPEDRDWAVRFCRDATTQKSSHDFEYRMIAADGRMVWMRDIVTVVVENGRATRLRGVMVDVTKRKGAEEALRRSEAYLAEAQRLTHTGSWAFQTNASRAAYWSEENFSIWGFDPHQGHPDLRAVLERIHPEDRDRVTVEGQKGLGEKTDYISEFRIVLPDGGVRHIHAVVHPVLGPSGVPVEVRGTHVDVTERKRAEEALQRSEAYLAEAQRLTHTGSWAYKAGGGAGYWAAHYWSEEDFRIWGFDPQQGLPTQEMVRQRIHPEDRDRVLEYVERAVRARTDYAREFRIVLPDETVRHIEVLGHPVFNASGELVEVVGTHVDVTERKRAEEEHERLRQLEAELAHINRVTTMGELTASLAHEVNQPIAAAMTNANTCVRWLAGEPPRIEQAREAAKRIVKETNRAGEIISRIRLLFKKSSPQYDWVNINEVISDIVLLVHNEAARHNVSVRTELDANLPGVMGDRVQLHQVLMNLVINSIEAMKAVDGKRELTFSSRRDAGNELLISVRDTGVGLPPDADAIFNAFFTTKAEGTGMGLAISRSIIESHGGRLWATSNSDRGAIFSFTLPTTSEAQA
jgi:PAS domain S-box-containing protein